MEEEFSLYTKMRFRVLEEVFEETREKCGNFVVIVDKKSLGVVSSAVRVFDITSKGAVVIELLEKPRKPMQMLDALYFLTAKQSSIDRLISDFEDPLYKSAYVHFTGHLSNDLMSKIAQSKLMSYIRVFKEANCNFRLVGSNHFSFESPGLLSSLYLCKSSSERKGLISTLAYNLASVCGVLNDFPYVCYQSSSLLSQEVALALEDNLASLYRKIPELHINDHRPILVIVDRSFDVPAVLMHDIHYEALLKDLFEVGPDGNVTYASYDNSNVHTQKEAVINEFDQLWTKLRYTEIDEAQGLLNQELKSFRSQNQEVERAADENMQDLRTMAKVVSTLSDYNETVKQFAVHRYLIENCLKSFSDEKITEISEIEQMLLTGFDTEKQTYTESTLINKTKALIVRMKDNKEKLRLALLLLSCIDLSESDLQDLIEILPPGLTLTLTKLSTFGITHSSSSDSKKRQTKQQIAELKKKIPPITKIFNYAVLKLTEIVSAANENKLETLGFRYCRQGPIDGSELDPAVQVKSLRKKQNLGLKAKRKIILFVVGGVSYSELRISADFPELQLVIGGSRVFSPLEFVQEMIEMGPNGRVEDLEAEEILLDFS